MDYYQQIVVARQPVFSHKQAYKTFFCRKDVSLLICPIHFDNFDIYHDLCTTDPILIWCFSYNICNVNLTFKSPFFALWILSSISCICSMMHSTTSVLHSIRFGDNLSFIQACESGTHGFNHKMRNSRTKARKNSKLTLSIVLPYKNHEVLIPISFVILQLDNSRNKFYSPAIQ